MSLKLQDREFSRRTSIWFLAIAAVIWSTSGVLTKLSAWPPGSVAALRSIASVLFLLPLTGIPKLPRTAAEYIGIIGHTLNNFLIIYAYSMTAAANVILLFYTAPIYVAVLGWLFLGERITRLDTIIILVVLGGISLFFLDSLSTGGMLGNILAAICGFIYAVDTVCLRKVKDSSPIALVFWSSLLSALIGIPMLLRDAPMITEYRSAIPVVLMGCLNMAAYYTFSLAIKKVSALEMVVVPCFEPILNPLLVAAVTGEIPGLLAIIGGVIVFGAITMRSVLMLRMEPPGGGDRAP